MRKTAYRIGNFIGGQQPGSARSNKRPVQRQRGRERQQPSAERLAERCCQWLACRYYSGGDGDTVRFGGGDWRRERITARDRRDVLAARERSGDESCRRNESGGAKPKPDQITANR